MDSLGPPVCAGTRAETINQRCTLHGAHLNRKVGYRATWLQKHCAAASLRLESPP